MATLDFRYAPMQETSQHFGKRLGRIIQIGTKFRLTYVTKHNYKKQLFNNKNIEKSGKKEPGNLLVQNVDQTINN